ncbi:MAG TPA: MFS transporter [Acidimicrobiia bacterium]|nr:MFS transporter [Acidimicrobiia bacterium]
MTARTGGRYLRLLADNADFRRLYLARLVSYGGDWFLLVPMLSLVHDLSRSPFLTAAVLTANTLPAFLLSPIGGVLADRVNRKKIIVWSSLVAAGASSTILFVDSSFIRDNGLGVTLVLGAMSILAALSALITPASSASLPVIVKPAELGDASFLLESTWGTMAAVGAALGGVVATLFGRRAAVAVDVTSFLVAATLIWRVRTNLSPHKERASGEPPARLRSAFTYIAQKPTVAALLTSKAGFAIFGGGAVALLPVLALDSFGAGDDGVGWLLAARGIGVVIGPFIIRRMVGGTDRAVLTSIGACMAFWGLSYLGTATAPSLLLAAAAVFLGHAGAGSQWSFSSYGLQLYTDNSIKGRIFGLDFAAVTLTSTMSQLLFGWLATSYSVRSIFFGLALAAIVFGLVWRRVTTRYWNEPAHAI